jgi:spoIIIJ-associated protein
VRDLLEEIVDRWGLDVEVTSAVHDDTVTVSLDGADAGMLAADDGRILEALQYLISKMTSRLLNDNVRVLIDAGGHREKRDQAIRARALEAAAEAKDSGRKVRLEPLSPYERRIVHILLKELGGIRTYSIGRGYLKRITIEPDEIGHDETEDAPAPEAKADEAE